MYDSVVDFAFLRRVAANLSVMEPGDRDRFWEMRRCMSEVDATGGLGGGGGFFATSAVIFDVTVDAVVGITRGCCCASGV